MGGKRTLGISVAGDPLHLSGSPIKQNFHDAAAPVEDRGKVLYVLQPAALSRRELLPRRHRIAARNFHRPAVHCHIGAGVSHSG